MTKGIFISHSHEDNDWVEAFTDELSQCNVDAWMDGKGLVAGDQWVQSIQGELGRREIFLVVVTPSSMASRWVNEEISVALHLNKLIVSLMVKPAKLPPLLEIRQTLTVFDFTPREASLALMKELGLYSSIKLELAEIYAFRSFLDTKFKEGKDDLGIVYTYEDGSRTAQFPLSQTEKLTHEILFFGLVSHLMSPSTVRDLPQPQFRLTFDLTIQYLLQRGWVKTGQGIKWYNFRFQRQVPA